MGLRRLLESPPDLVLSGVNAGQNIADDVTYSGTVAGAMEGTLLGIRSIALSQAYQFDGGERLIPWDVAESHAPALLERLIAARPAGRHVPERELPQLRGRRGSGHGGHHTGAPRPRAVDRPAHGRTRLSLLLAALQSPSLGAGGGDRPQGPAGPADIRDAPEARYHRLFRRSDDRRRSREGDLR